MAFTLSSSAFANGGKIPGKYTCEGQNAVPPLAWRGVPEGTACFTLLVDDPDAPGGTFTHWVLFNIPRDTDHLDEGAFRPSGSVPGKTSFGKSVWGGPCPPPGPAHHYNFALYALDKTLDLKEGASKQQVLAAMQGHVLGETRLTGLFQRGV
jgi:Raf kinase inhibitor-like YbhB/YbcL family protein